MENPAGYSCVRRFCVQQLSKNTGRKISLRLVIVTGMSGAGKTTALKTLEDMGFYCADNLPERFQLEYTGADNQKHRPVMVHRAPFGSMERFVAVLIEHTAGKFPLWLTPDQVAILPISEKFNDYAHEVKQYLKRYDIRAIVDERNEKIGRKIRDNEMKRIPYMLVVGEKEAENKEVAVRKQGEGDKGTMKFEEFAKKMNEEVQNMINKW